MIVGSAQIQPVGWINRPLTTIMPADSLLQTAIVRFIDGGMGILSVTMDLLTQVWQLKPGWVI